MAKNLTGRKAKTGAEWKAENGGGALPGQQSLPVPADQKHTQPAPVSAPEEKSPAVTAAEQHDKELHDRLEREQTLFQKMLSEATALAETLEKDKQWMAFSHAAIIHKREDDYRSIAAYKIIKKLPAEQLARLPYPKTTIEDAAKTNMPDVFDVIKTKRLNAKKELVNYTTSYYKTIAEALPEGKRAVETLLHIEMAENGNNDAPQRILAMGKPMWEAEKAGCRLVINTLTDSLRKAAHIYLQEKRMESLQLVHFAWTTDSKGEIVKSNKPIWCVERKPEKAGTKEELNMGTIKTYSVGQFLSWDIPGLLKKFPKGATLDRLAKSGAKVKGTTTTTTTTTASKFTQRSVGEMLEAMRNVLSFYESGGTAGETEHYRQLISQADKDDGDNWCLVTLADKLHAIAAQPGRRERAKTYADKLNASSKGATQTSTPATS